jgi:hypothetical protein
MRENCTYGSEGGEAKSLPYPYQWSLWRDRSTTNSTSSPPTGRRNAPPDDRLRRGPITTGSCRYAALRPARYQNVEITVMNH